MSEKDPNFINVPDSVWQNGKIEERPSFEIVGSLDFKFVQVPYDLEGSVEDIFDDEGKEKPGIENIEEVDIELIPSQLGLSLNVNGVENMDSDTRGAFLNFLGSSSSQRYILLDKHKNELDELRKHIPRIKDDFRKKFLEVFVRNADLAIEKYGKKAALVIL